VESVLACLPAGSRVAILRLRSLGDCVLTTPALAILKRFRPDLRIALAVEDRFREIFEGNSDIDEILAAGIGAVRRFRPALCLNLHGGTRSAWMTALSGARWRAGFGHFRNGFAYNVRIPRAQEILRVDRKVHTAEHLASAVFYLGAERCEVPGAKLEAAQAKRPVPLPVPLAVIHPMAATPEKTWHAEGFLAVAEHLQAGGVEPVFIGAASDDLSPFARFRTVKGAPLAEIKTLLSSAGLFVGNDSGPAHMAAAFGVPVVAIFSASDPDIWRPWRTSHEIVRAPASTEQVLRALARLRVHA
jgi:ADP-heptose:LPS heptosyltransferase